MPALTITAVDFTTDQLTIPAHGLNTGDGAAAIYTAAGTLPAPLAAVTDYWVIRDSANLIRLASSSSNALAGTAINLTTNGSGTLQLLIGLPYRVPRIAAVGGQIMPQDDNAAWQSLVALWNMLTGQAQSVYNGVTLAGDLTLAAGNLKHGTRTLFLDGGAFQVANPAVGTPTWDVGGGCFQAPLNAFASIPLLAGHRITAIRIYCHDNGVGPTKLQASLISSNHTGSSTIIASSAVSSGAGADQTLSIGSLTTTLISGTSYKILVATTTGSALSHVYGVEIDYDRP